MTQSMKRWVLAAVIAAAMVIASAGMGAAATIALDDDGADFASVNKQKLIEHGIEIAESYDVSEVTLINGKKFTVVKGNVNGNIESFTIDPNGEISPGVKRIIDEEKEVYSRLSKAELKLGQELLKIAKEGTDSEEDEIPVFISAIDKESIPELRDYLESHKLASKVELQNYLPGIATDVNAATLNELVELDYVLAIYSDSPLEMFLNASVPTIRVNGNNFPTWTDNTLGSGVTVAIVDNGIDITHPNIINNFDSGDYSKRGQSESGHGTAIAGIIASNNGTYKGVTPGVSLLDASVEVNSWVDAAQAIEWAVAGPDGTKGSGDDANIIQMSCGEHTLGNLGNTELYGLSNFVDEVVFQEDIVFTVAVGQNDAHWEPVVSPAEAYNVISVGAIDDHNTADVNDDTIYMEGFYGTVDERQKPDIVAPGHRIITANYRWDEGEPDLSELIRFYFDRGDLDLYYVVGTSYAAPHVAGAAAILLSNNPDLSAKQVKAILLNTPFRNPYLSDEERERVGYGLLNVNEAYKNIHNSLIGTIRDTGGEGLYYELTPDEGGDSRITMVWERQANTRDASVPDANVMGLTDLDMYLFKDGNKVAHSSSRLDNVEQIIYQSNSEVPESFVLKIVPENLNNNQEETFALAYYGSAFEVHPPDQLTSLVQWDSVGATEIPFGGITDENTVLFDGVVSDPDNNDVQLEVEVRPIGTAFTGTPTCTSDPAVASGSTASATCTGLSDGQYHWQARAKDSADITGQWLSAGGNPETSPDFEVRTSGRSGGPDDFGYTFTDSNTPEGPTYDWIEISGTGTEVLPDSDDSWVEDIGLGFFFNYYGTDYSQLAISNNGLLFSGGTTWQYVNEPITQTPGVHGFIAPFWDDIVTWGSAGAIYHQTIGTAPNRMFVVEWYDNQHYSSSTSGVIFEAILYEGSNNIIFQYKDVDFGTVNGAVGGDNPPYDHGGSATVGIEGPDGDDGLQYSFNEQVIDPGLAILFKFPQFAGTNLYLSKQAPAGKDRGSTMTYTLHYHNFGDTPAQNVVLEDTLPAEVEFVSASDGGSYNSGTRKVTWNIGSVAPNGHGYETISVRIQQNTQIGTVIQNDASISTSNLEVRYDDNEAHAQTRVAGSSLPPDVGVEPNNGGTGTPSIYWINPITFSYHSSDTATSVDIRIQVNDGGPDITGSMTGGPSDWTYTTTFYPRHGRATVTYTVSGESCQSATTPTLPSTISVLRTATGQVEVVDFKDYVKNVLPNEWISSWDMDALKAGAMAAKTYAWYWTIHQKYPGQDYDVKDTIGDQVYIPGTANSRTNQAVEETWNWLMTKNGEIFQAQYDSGTSGSPDPLHAGRMSQWGTQYWAEQGKDWQWIVHNYYDPVEGPCVPTVTFDIYIDPAGYIYDANTDERIEGATVWLQRPDGTGGWVNVPTGEVPPISQPDENPLITGPDGQYQWDVMAGSYRVHVEAAGYYPANSIVVGIPPAVTDLHVGLTRIPSENEPPVATDDGVTMLEDTAVTINVTANDNDVDGNLDPTTANTDCIVCSGPTHGTLTNHNNGTFTYTPDPDYNGHDSFIYEICDTEGLCDTATVTIDVTAVNDAPVISVDVTEQTVQYSDGIANITISATDVDSSSLTISTRWTKDGGDVQPDLPSALVLSAGECILDSLPATWVWILEGQALVDAGTYNIKFTISDGEDEIEACTTLVVEPESAAVAFDGTNPVAVQVAEPGGNSEAFSLTVDVTEAMPDLSGSLLAYPSDISLAEVSVSLVPVGPGSPAEPTSCSLEVVGTGYDAILALTFGFNDVAVNTYAVQVTVDRGYYIGSGEDVVVIYDPSLGFTTGGGTFLWPETGEKTNFGYTMKYNKKATNIKGNLLLVRHLQDGTIYRVKSNALYGLALGEYEDDGETYGWASFSGKATYLEPEWDEPIGNYEFITYVEDHGEPGKNIDRIWIKIMNRGNTVDVMSMDDHGANNAVELSGGNIVVPHNANR